jgi:general nucleoside transport system permease protein
MDLSQFISAAFLVTWFTAALHLSGPLLLASLGEIFCERSGVLNVGIEGTILLGALASYLVTHVTGVPLWGLCAALIAGLISNIFLAWMYVTVRASQVVVGIVFNILCLGVASFVYRLATGEAASPLPVVMFQPLYIDGLTNLPYVGVMLFGQTTPFYWVLALTAASSFFLFHTRFGLALRAVGENPRAAEAAGIKVKSLRYIGVLICGVAAGAAGGYLMLCEVGMFRDTIVTGQGFIALAIVILGRWSPWKAALAALVFSSADALQLSLQLFSVPVPPQLLLSLPYVMTIMAISGLVGGKASQPAGLMVPYEPN